MAKKPSTVAVSGAFDPIHVGHVRYIKAAAKLGDRLVVILNSDSFLLQKKGFVFTPFTERKEIIENIKGVSEVIPSIDEDQTVRKTLEQLKPDIFAKGGSIERELIPEAETCKSIGCKVLTNVGGQIKAAKEGRALKISCPYCGDHPMLRHSCLYCKGTGKIEVGKSVSTHNKRIALPPS